jgi:hypothetical protein
MNLATVAEIAGNSTNTIYEHYDKDVSLDEQNHARIRWICWPGEIQGGAGMAGGSDVLLLALTNI